MSILGRIDRIIVELKEIPSEPEFKKRQDELQPIYEASLKAIQDFGNTVSKMAEDEAMMETLKKDLITKVDAYSFASLLSQDEKQKVVEMVLSGKKNLPSEDELLAIILKSLRDAPVEELIRTAYSEADVVRVGAITQPQVGKKLQYTEGMKQLKESYDNPNGIEDLLAMSMRKIEGSPETKAKYFKMYMGV